MFLYCLSVRILVFVIGALQMESSGVKGISDVPLEQACLCHWIKSPFQLLKSSTSELVRHRKSHHITSQGPLSGICLTNDHLWGHPNLRSGIIFLLLLLLLLWLEREESNTWYIHLTSREPLSNLHNLVSTRPVMLSANQRLPDGNQILVRIMSLLNLRIRKFLNTFMFRWCLSKKMF